MGHVYSSRVAFNKLVVISSKLVKDLPHMRFCLNSVGYFFIENAMAFQYAMLLFSILLCSDKFEIVWDWIIFMCRYKFSSTKKEVLFNEKNKNIKK